MKVIIIGSGLTALTAASYLAGMFHTEDSDTQKIQIELLSDGSGASPYVHGVNIPLHPKDTTEIFANDTKNSGYQLSKNELVSALCEDSTLLMQDLASIGIELEKKDGEYVLLKPLGSSFPRVASSSNHTGAEIMRKMQDFLISQPNVRCTKKARALRMNCQNGRIHGVLIWNEENNRMEYKQADAVLIACGGFCGIYPFSTNSHDIGGDGIAMAYEAGLSLTDMEFVQFEPSVALYPESVRGKGMITTMFYEGAVLRNGEGKRFMPTECVGKDVLAKAIYREITSGIPTPHGGVYFDATAVGREKLLESYPSYVERYAQAGMNIAEEMFEIAPAPHTSLGGIVVNEHCESEMNGIFAAGEAIGGLHGANRLGGNAGLETLVFGKRAGVQIKQYLENLPNSAQNVQTENSVFELLTWAAQKKGTPLSGKQILQYRQQMQEILQKNLFVERNGYDLQSACEKIENMLQNVRAAACPEDAYHKIRLENDLICANILAHSALAREESIGCHIRTDAKEAPLNDRYHIVIRKELENMKIEKQRLEGIG